MSIMQRITIAGNSGAGKSTFAEKLSKSTGIAVYHLDLIQFKPGWQKTPEKEFYQMHNNWLTQPSWIIEGVGPWNGLKQRFETADTIIYLDFPEDYCLQKARQRSEKDKISPNPFVPPDSPYAAKEDRQEEVIRFFQREWRPKILRLMDSFAEERNLFVFTRPEALDDFLAEIKMPPAI